MHTNGWNCTFSQVKLPVEKPHILFSFALCPILYIYIYIYIVKVKFAQSCPTLCDPTDYTVYGILQARILEWVTFLFSKGLLHPGIEPRSPTLQVDSLPAEPQLHI